MRTQNYQFLSLWEIAHRWENLDPDAPLTQTTTPLKLRDRLQQLIWNAIHSLNCFDQHGEHIPEEELWITGIRKTRFAKQLDVAFGDPFAHKDFLKGVFLSQKEVKEVYVGVGEVLPSFWFEDWEIAESVPRTAPSAPVEAPETHSQVPSVKTRLRPDQQDKATCQQIARELWAKYPDMTIADMIRRPEIQIEGNGKAYKGRNTLRDWLKAVAPPDVRNRRGRPKKKGNSE